MGRGLRVRFCWTGIPLPLPGDGTHGRWRLDIRKSRWEACFQLFDVPSLLARASLMAWAISLALRRSKSISDCFNIRGAGEIPSLRLSKAVDGVSEMFLPPLFEVLSVFLSEFMEMLIVGGQLSRAGLAGQADGADGAGGGVDDLVQGTSRAWLTDTGRRRPPRGRRRRGTPCGSWRTMRSIWC